VQGLTCDVDISRSIGESNAITTVGVIVGAAGV
jgi:hypothetical protein